MSVPPTDTGADFLPPISDTRPLFFGPPDVAEGYFLLETVERRVMLASMNAHRQPVRLWYRGLTLYWRGMHGARPWPGEPLSDVERAAQVTQSRLIGLGIISAKVALDTLLAGYYSAAFGSIRHLIEIFIQVCYLESRPERAPLWYAPRTLPKCKSMVAELKRRPPEGWSPGAFARVYERWEVMSSGSHPSGAGIAQTDSPGDEPFVLGATHRRDLADIGFNHGLAAVDVVLVTLAATRPQTATWHALREQYADAVTEWQEAEFSARRE